MFVAAEAVAGSVSGTTTIDNPNRPADWACDNFAEMNTSTPAACGEPKQIDVDRSRHAATAIRQLVPGVLLGLIGLWVLFSGLFAAAETDTSDLFVASAWTLPPLALPAVARTAVVIERAPSRSWPGELDALAEAARRAVLADGATVVIAASVVAVVWVGAVLYGIGRDYSESSWASVAPVVGMGLLAVGIPLQVPTVGMLAPPLVFAVIGLPFTFVPRVALRLSARHELIGYSGKEQVEPKEWYVRLNRLFGVVLIVAGLLFAWVPAYLV
jgi:hypothetical protein